MRFAYADPPYFGCGASHYGEHHAEAAAWDDRQTHLDLIAHLTDNYLDGWVLSCNPRDLAWLLPACPDDARVAAWCKTWHQIRPTTVQFAWPAAFNQWVLDLLNYQDGDTLDDLFPGTGGMAATLAAPPLTFEETA